MNSITLTSKLIFSLKENLLLQLVKCNGGASYWVATLPTDGNHCSLRYLCEHQVDRLSLWGMCACSSERSNEQTKDINGSMVS